MADPQSLLVKQTLDSLNSSLSILESLSVLPAADAAAIRSKLPVHNGAGGWQAASSGPSSIHSPGGSLIDVSGGGGSSSSPYPQPIYGQGSGATRAPPPPGRSAGLGEARASWDYEASAPDDLGFRKDDLIIITEESNSDWWKGYVSSNPSHIGLFPSNYVKRLPPSNLPPRPYSSSPAPPPFNEKHAQSYGGAPSYAPPPPHQYHSPPPPHQYGGYNQQPMVPYQQPYQQPYPPPPPPQQQMVQQPPPQQVVQQEQQPQKQGKFDGMGRLLASSAVGGVGFGAGSAVGSGLINAIF